ncbi:MAG: WD40/YVTN/BNR-like repeat-containing protein, partial [Gaiellaceae bacterium]
MRRKHRRLLVVAGALLALTAAALSAALMHGPSAPQAAPGGEEAAPALARKLAAMATFSPGTAAALEDNPAGFADQDWLEKSTDGAGNSPPDFTAFANARNDWFGLKARPANGSGAWVPYGPTNGVNPPNPFRDRAVYNAGTENFSGRTVHAAIAPDCKPAPDECNLWIANANGGVWRTEQALAPEPVWEYLSQTFEQNNVSSLELDPNDSDHRTIWAGTGEPNACGSGCEVGVGVYQSKSGGTAWKGPLGADSFFGRAVGSIEVKPGDSETIFAASGRATRGITNTCCGGTDALIPGAPHFGVYRSLDEGKSWELVNQGADALCTGSHPDVVSLNQTACSPRGARRIKIDPVDPNTVYASFFARGIWRSRSNGDPGTWQQIMVRVGPNPALTAERA